MKTIRLFSRACLLAALATSLFGAAPATLTLNDLRNHPERWPAQVTLPRDFKFNGGKSARKGQSVQVVELKGTELVVDAGNGLVFGLPVADSNFLIAANTAWSALTPAQRELDANALITDVSLWPLRVKSVNGFHLQNGSEIPANSEFDLVSVTQEGVTLFSAKYNTNIGADLKDTDLIARARELVLIPASERPSRIAAALNGNLIDSSGKAVANNFDQTQLFALYYGASWCPPCRTFSPGFVKYINQISAENPKLTVVLMSNDKVDAEMLKYMKAESMPWAALPLSKLQRNPLFLSYTKGSIPQLVIVDRAGKVLADSYNGTRYLGPDVAKNGLAKLLDTGIAR